MKIKKVLSVLVIMLLTVTAITGCGTGKKNEEKAIKITTTIFPQYDFAKRIGGDRADVKMLLKPGAESHSFEPTPQDIKTISESDLFIYTGGENDTWVKGILDSMDSKKKPKAIKLLDMVKTVEEEHVEGMEEEKHDHDSESSDEHDSEHKEDSHESESEHEDEHKHEVDEHVWTSPKNALQIAEKIKDEMIAKDKDGKEIYEKNFKELKSELEALDKEFKSTVDSAKRKTVLFGDRFPFRYLADEYGLKYYAAFSGCSTDSEASAKTVAFLIDKVKEEKLPVVFTIELSNGKIADTIVESTGAKKLTLHSCHNLTTDEMKKGVSYVDLMKENIKNLKTALN